MSKRLPNRYQALVEDLFFTSFKKGATAIAFTRDELLATADKLGIKMPKNPGDVLYSFRYRYPLPERILKTQPGKMEWVIEGANYRQPQISK